MNMKKSDLIKEVSENLKAFSIAFRYLESVQTYKEGRQDEYKFNDDSKIITLKPMRIDKYQTSTYMQSVAYFKPISRYVTPRHTGDKTEETEEMI